MWEDLFGLLVEVKKIQKAVDGDVNRSIPSGI